jgi:hypothetical protein
VPHTLILTRQEGDPLLYCTVFPRQAPKLALVLSPECLDAIMAFARGESRSDTPDEPAS